ncbi:MAG: glycosyltransferase [Nanoarchaeota archaeon]|nr:glycosyltransferase [Nanoarchaeota archaeon]
MNIFYSALVYTVWFLSTYFVVFFLLALFTFRNKLFEEKKFSGKTWPFVSILVPAYNEQGKIHKTINSLKKVVYKRVEFIIINDGSKDGTSKEVRKHIKGDSRFIFIDRKKNMGKAASLNEGIKKGKGAYFGCMDADSIIEPTIIEKCLPYFEDDIGAVTVNVEVVQPRGILHKVMELEFILGLSLFLKIYSFFDSVFVTPGPFSIFSKKVLDEIGGFDANCIVEDMEISFRIRKAGYRIVHCMDAKVQTILPRGFRKLYVQRRRWYSGALETVFQHKHMLFNRKYGVFSFLIPFNYILMVLGLGLFIATQFLGLSRLFRNLYNFRYTNFNFLERLLEWEFDVLGYSSSMILGLIMFSFTVLIMILGLRYARKTFNARKTASIGYPFIFFLYQIFWIGSLYAVIRRKKVSWR